MSALRCGVSALPLLKGRQMALTEHELSSLWDLQAIAEEPLRVRVLGEEAVGWGRSRVRLREVRYYSHDGPDGEIIIAAYIAVPATKAPMPAIVKGTGDVESAVEFARKHRIVTVLIDRPGTGESTGPVDDYVNWVRFSHPCESWMWHFVTAALRAVTLASTLPEVDPDRLAITGTSRGGTMSWIANGIDTRLKLAIPVATGGDIVRALDHGGWANYLYWNETGCPGMPPEFYDFARYYDPIHYAGRQHGAVVLIVGAQDEFFPLYCTKTTADAFATDEFRLLIIANWDHKYFFGNYPEVDAYDNTREARRKQDRTVHAAIDAYLGGGSLPPLPTLEVASSRKGLLCLVRITRSEARRVALYVSLDGAYTFRRIRARPASELFEALVTAPDSSLLEGATVFAEVEYEDGPILTSLPWFGAAFRQRMRPFPSE